MPDTPIPLATSSTYTLVTGDIGANIFCRVTAHNSVGDASADSNTVGPVTAAGGGDVTAPTITSSASVSNAENSVLAHSLTANETVTWSLIGGADLARFELSGSTLRWLSNGTKDFEAPNDADTNNAYIVQVRATDTALNTADQTVTVTVTNVAEGSYTGLGNVVSGATGYWGLRAYNAAYATGSNPGIDIRNAADTTTTTLNILADGSLDVASVPGSGGPFKVSKVYDQVGTNHLIQTTHAQRPTLVLNAVGTRPAMQGAGTQNFETSAVVTRAQPFTATSYVKTTTTGGSIQYVFYSSGANFQVDYGSGPSTTAPDMNAGADVYTSGLPLVWYGFQTVFNGASSDLNINGTVLTGDAGTGGIAASLILVMGASGSSGVVGFCTEFGVWPSAFSGANSSAIYANQAAWWV